MPIKVKYSDKIRKKYHFPDYFQNKDDEIKFWQNFNQDKKMEMFMDYMAEYHIKKYGKIPRLVRVIRIKKRRTKK